MSSASPFCRSPAGVILHEERGGGERKGEGCFCLTASLTETKRKIPLSTWKNNAFEKQPLFSWASPPAIPPQLCPFKRLQTESIAVMSAWHVPLSGPNVKGSVCLQDGGFPQQRDRWHLTAWLEKSDFFQRMLGTNNWLLPPNVL